MIALMRDLRHATRVFVASPGFSAAAVLTIAVGVGATAAIFAIVNTVLLRPLPFPGADRVVVVGGARVDAPQRMTSVSLEDLRDWQRQSRTIESFAAWRDWGMTRYDDPNEKGVYAAIVTPEIFRVLPVAPVLGRLFRPDDDKPIQNRVILLSYGYWRSRFGGDRGVIGRTMILEREDKAVYTIIGVLPARFNELPSFGAIKVFALSSTDPDAATGRAHRNRRVFARLRGGMSIREARTDLQAIAGRLAVAYPGTNARWTATVRSLVDDQVGPLADTLRTFFAAVACVLLIACANLASLQLARALSRQREFAVRAALGGGGVAIARGVVLESVLLSIAGGAVGLLASQWLVAIVLRTGPTLPRAETVRLDAAVIVFAFATCLVAGLTLAVPASWLIARVDPATALRNESRPTAPKSAVHARMAFVAAQVALAVVLCAGALVAGETLVRQMLVRPGFDPAGLASLQLSASLAKYKTRPQMADLLMRLVEMARTAPGVTSASAVSALPTSGEGREPVEFSVVGGDEASMGHLAANSFNVAPGYFRTMGIPLRRGRDFAPTDTAGAPGVAIVNESFVRRCLPASADPLDTDIRLSRGDDMLKIVGVVADVLQEIKPQFAAEPEIYWPYGQRPRWSTFLVVRSSAPRAAVAAMRVRAGAIDPDLHLGAPRIVSDTISQSARGPRFVLLLFGLFAGVAGLLGAIGVYGLVSYTSEQRIREIGIRISLGAGPRQIFMTVASGGFRAVAAGAIIGTLGAVALMHTSRSMLPQMEALRPGLAIAAAIALTLLGCLACYLPARRALRVDPLEALRRL